MIVLIKKAQIQPVLAQNQGDFPIKSGFDKVQYKILMLRICVNASLCPVTHVWPCPLVAS